MKKPILNQFERFAIRQKSLIGSHLELGFAVKKFEREFGRTLAFRLIDLFGDWINKKL